MTDQHGTAWGQESADADLISAVRLGDTAAFDVLYRRHAGAAKTVARQHLHSASEVDDAVADAFTKVFAILSAGGGPDIAFRAYLFTVVRRRAFEMVNGARRTRPTDDMAAFESVLGPLASTEEPALEGFERTTVAQAFRSLPERWQSILWYSEVEGLTPAAIAPILGLTANGAAALAYRAREGLREAYLQQHLSSVPADECRRANALLGSFVRGGLAKRETAVVEHHLEDCGECRALVLELGDVAHGMRAVIAPLVLGLAGAGLVGTALPTWGPAAGVATATALATGAPAASGSTTGGGGAATAGGAASGGGAASAGGLGAVLASAPALVAGIAAIVVTAGVAVAALLGVFDDDVRSADPTVASTTDGASDGTAGDDASSDPAQDPTTDPSSPTAVPAPPTTDDSAADGADDGSTDDSTDADARSDAPRSPAPVDPAPESDQPAPASPDGTAPSTVVPVQPPSTDPVDPVPLGLKLGLATGTDLVARQNNTLALSLSNTGLDLVADVAVELTIPSGLTFVPGDPATAGAFGPRVLVLASGEWTCLETPASGAGSAGATVVRCEMPEISGGASTDLSLDVYAEDSGASVVITAQVFVGTEAVGPAREIASTIATAPARLDVGVVPVADLVAGRPGHVAVKVRNLGEEAATQARIDIPLAPGSGLTWRAEAGRVEPAGPDRGWSCVPSAVAGASVASCTHATGVPGDGSASVILPVTVAAGSAFDGTVVPVVAHAGDAAGQPGIPQPLAVVARGLSAAALLDGPLQTAQVSAAVGEPAMLAVPAGATVRHAELVWSGSDAEGASAAALASVELRGEAGGLGLLSMAGTPVTVDVPGAGPQGYWAAGDVTSMLAAHATSGRWLVAPLPGATVPADLRWTLTVVYEVAGQPDATVTLLSGPPAPGAPQAGRTLALPAAGPVTVAATGTVRGSTPSVVANGRTLTSPPGTGVLTYRSDDLLRQVTGTSAPLALRLAVPSGVGSGAFDSLAVHASAVPSAAGVLDQPVGVVLPSVVIDPVTPGVAGGPASITVRNTGDLPVASVHVTFEIPPGLVTVTAPVDGLACSDVMQGGQVTCVVAPLPAGQSATLPLELRAPDGQIDAGNLTYSLSAPDLLTGVPFLSDGVLVRADR